MIINKDCLEALKELPDNSIDSIITDPPYGLSFMGKKWDYDVPSTEIWSECLRVLKPGGYLLAFAGTRTQHRMAVRIEDAGFEIRDMIAWVYGSGFPKSLNIGKAVDKLQGNEREVLGKRQVPDQRSGGISSERTVETGGVKTRLTLDTKGTSEWEGWGTALKPALEPITVARKPIEGTVAENCLKWGVGGINIDGSRVGTEDKLSIHKGNLFHGNSGIDTQESFQTESQSLGRFPANLIHDGSEEVLELFPETKSGGGNKGNVKNGTGMFGNGKAFETEYVEGNSGSAARFFYCAKASKSERNMGLDGFEEKEIDNQQNSEYKMQPNGELVKAVHNKRANNHPTVKPIRLMEYLVNLVSKEGHTVLDPFAGSGTTGIACKKLNRNFIGVERDEEYCKIAEARINNLTLK